MKECPLFNFISSEVVASHTDSCTGVLLDLYYGFCFWSSCNFLNFKFQLFMTSMYGDLAAAAVCMKAIDFCILILVCCNCFIPLLVPGFLVNYLESAVVKGRAAGGVGKEEMTSRAQQIFSVVKLFCTQ